MNKLELHDRFFFRSWSLSAREKPALFSRLVAYRVLFVLYENTVRGFIAIRCTQQWLSCRVCVERLNRRTKLYPIASRLCQLYSDTRTLTLPMEHSAVSPRWLIDFHVVAPTPLLSLLMDWSSNSYTGKNISEVTRLQKRRLFSFFCLFG